MGEVIPFPREPKPTHSMFCQLCGWFLKGTEETICNICRHEHGLLDLDDDSPTRANDQTTSG